MKKTIFVLCLMVMCIKVNAICSNDEYTKLKNKADKIELVYDYKVITVEDYLCDPYKDFEYSLVAYNLDSELDVVVTYNDYLDVTEPQLFKYNKNKTSKLNGFTSGKLKVVVSSNKGECKGRSIVTKFINLPYYNLFYGTDKCADYPNFKYCISEISETYVDESIFDKELTKYINDTNNEKKVETPEKSGIAIWETIKTVFIIMVLVSVIGYVLFKIIQGEKRRRSL